MGMLHVWGAFQEPQCLFCIHCDLLCNIWLKERGGGAAGIWALWAWPNSIPQISNREGCSACRTRTSKVQTAILAGMPLSGSLPRNLSGVFPFLWVGFVWVFFPAVFQENASQQVGLQKHTWNKNYIKKITGISINFGVCDPEINLTQVFCGRGWHLGSVPSNQPAPLECWQSNTKNKGIHQKIHPQSL